MSDLPARIAVWPDFVGHPSMTGQWSANTHPDNAVAYVRADLSDALLREAMEALGGVMAACDHGRLVATTGVGGMTIEANIRGSVYMGVPAWPIEEARATLAKLRSHMGGNHE